MRKSYKNQLQKQQNSSVYWNKGSKNMQDFDKKGLYKILLWKSRRPK